MASADVPRKPREEFAGAIYHVWARCVRREPLFKDDADCQVYLVILKGVVAVYGWRVLSYCLMTNHIHLVVETPYPNLGAGMRRLHGHYATFFNRRHELGGHLFERRYRHNLIKDDVQLAVALAYVAHNPVKAGLCARPEDWRRSSAAGDDFCVDFARLHTLTGEPGSIASDACA
jgi:putative transposase